MELSSDWLLRTLHRAISDLSNPTIDFDGVETLRVSLELVHRELEVRVVTCTTSTLSSYQEAAEYVRSALLVITTILEEVYRRDSSNVTVTLSLPDGGIGRPRFNITYFQLVYLLEHRFSVPQIGHLLGVSVRTVRRRMEQYGLSVQMTYTEISDTDLCERVSYYQRLHPYCGNRQMAGLLLTDGIRVTQERLRECQRRVDPDGSALRRLHVIHRREYRVPRPLALWHLDSNHKLIRYAIV